MTTTNNAVKRYRDFLADYALKTISDFEELITELNLNDKELIDVHRDCVPYIIEAHRFRVKQLEETTNAPLLAY